MKKYLFIVILVLLSACAFLVYQNKRVREDRDRLKSNQTALLQEVESYKTKDGKNAVSIQMLELKRLELEDGRKELLRTISDLKIKLKRVQSVSQTELHTNVAVNTIVKDSIVIVRDSTYIPTLSFKWNDPWVSVEGLIQDKKVDMAISSIDTLTHVVHRVPHKFLFFKWGTKAVRQSITSSNPHTSIVYAEYIQLK